MPEIVNLQETLIYLEALGDHGHWFWCFGSVLGSISLQKAWGAAKLLPERQRRERTRGWAPVTLFECTLPNDLRPPTRSTASSFCHFLIGPHWGSTHGPLGKFKMQTSTGATSLSGVNHLVNVFFRVRGERAKAFIPKHRNWESSWQTVFTLFLPTIHVYHKLKNYGCIYRTKWWSDLLPQCRIIKTV